MNIDLPLRSLCDVSTTEELCIENRILREQIMILKRERGELVDLAEDLARIITKQNREARDPPPRRDEAILLEIAHGALEPFARLAALMGDDVETSPGEAKVFLHQRFHELPKLALLNAKGFCRLMEQRHQQPDHRFARRSNSGSSDVKAS